MRWIPLVVAMLCLWVLPGQSPDQGGTERTCAIWIKLIGTRPVRNDRPFRAGCWVGVGPWVDDESGCWRGVRSGNRHAATELAQIVNAAG